MQRRLCEHDVGSYNQCRISQLQLAGNSSGYKVQGVVSGAEKGTLCVLCSSWTQVAAEDKVVWMSQFGCLHMLLAVSN